MSVKIHPFVKMENASTLEGAFPVCAKKDIFWMPHEAAVYVSETSCKT